MPQNRIQPDDILMRDLTGSHPHIGAAGGTGKNKTSILKSRRLRTKEGTKCIGATLAPVRIMIAGDDIPGLVQAVKKRPGLPQLRVRSKLRDIPGDDDEFQFVIGVDIPDRVAKVLRR